MRSACAKVASSRPANNVVIRSIMISEISKQTLDNTEVRRDLK
jgi:hypothetical protein